MVSQRSASSPLGHHVQRRARAALGDQHAEVLARTGDALRGVVRTPCPRRTVGCAQLHEERVRRGSQPVDHEGVIPGAHPDVRDGLQPLGRGPLDAERVGDVETVCPGLHQPRGGHRRGAHRRTEPRQLAAVGHRKEFLVQPGPGRTPVRQQLRRWGDGEFLGACVDEPDGVRGRLLEHRRERGFVGDRFECDAVRPQQMCDLMGDRPARRGR